MTEKELLSKKTFIDLFKKNELDRIEREDELFIEARKLGIKRFKETLKKYQNLLKEKISIDNDLKASKMQIRNRKL